MPRTDSEDILEHHRDESLRLQHKHEMFERWALIGFLACQLESLDTTDLVVLADQLLIDFKIEYKGF
jgi:hypothetical protein